MGSDSNLGGSPSASSPSAKRTRDAEEEVYVDNLRSHKRYLSEIMASSLNGLTVGDSLPDNLMESPARSESMFSFSNDGWEWELEFTTSYSLAIAAVTGLAWTKVDTGLGSDVYVIDFPLSLNPEKQVSHQTQVDLWLKKTTKDLAMMQGCFYFAREVETMIEKESSSSLESLEDDMSLQYSPMSEDSDDLRFCETPVHSCSSHPDSIPSSPVSPHRYQKPQNALSSAPSSSSNASHRSTISTVTCSQPRQRGSDSEGRFPSSPSDICHSADLRRATLLRSVQMRTQPPGSASLDLSFGSNQEPAPNIDPEERPCSYMKSLVDDREY